MIKVDGELLSNLEEIYRSHVYWLVYWLRIPRNCVRSTAAHDSQIT